MSEARGRCRCRSATNRDARSAAAERDDSRAKRSGRANCGAAIPAAQPRRAARPRSIQVTAIYAKGQTPISASAYRRPGRKWESDPILVLRILEHQERDDTEADGDQADEAQL